MKLQSVCLLALSLLLTPYAGAVSLLESAQLHFNPQTVPRLGIEVEFEGFTLEQTAEIIHLHFHNSVVTEKPYPRLMGYKTSGEPIIADLIQFEIQTEELGIIRLVPEINDISFSDNESNLNGDYKIVELISAPLNWKQIHQLQILLDILKLSGAQGTSAERSVSIQVNVEIAEGQRDKIEKTEVLNYIINLLRIYSTEKNRTETQELLNIPPNRLGFLNEYSDGFLSKINEPGYAPTYEEFLNDFIYRQGYELMGQPGAWYLPINIIQDYVNLRILDPNEETLERIVKLNRFNISPFLKYVFPEHFIFKTLEKNGSFLHARPALEFRENNNDFNLLQAAQRFVGFMQIVESPVRADCSGLLSH